MENMLNQKIVLSGVMPAGKYVLVLDSMQLGKDVVSIPLTNVDKDLRKQIANKEKAVLTPELIRTVENMEIPNFTFDDGQPKPRFQNKIFMHLHEKNSGNKYTVTLFGGPSIDGKNASVIKQIWDVDVTVNLDKELGEFIHVGDEINAYLTVNGTFNNPVLKSMRKVGLTPLPEDNQEEETPKSSEGFTEFEGKLVAYLMGPGAGMPTRDLSTMATKGIVFDGTAFDDMGTILNAWSGIKSKVKQAVDGDKVAIILK